LHLRCIALAAIVIALSVSAALAQEWKKTPVREKPSVDNGLPAFPLFESEAFARGDFNKLFTEAVDFIRQHPDSPQAELLMRCISGNWHRITNRDLFEPVLEQILEKDLKNGFNEELFREKLASFYYKRGLREKARHTRNYDGYILDCLIIGPFGKTSRTCIEEVYEPEIDLLERKAYAKLAAKEYTGSNEFRKLKWRKYPYEKPVRNPYVNIFSYLPSDRYGGAGYALVQVSVEEPRVVLIDISAGGCFKLWVNQTLVLNPDSDRERQPDSYLAPVRFAKGCNHILIKLPASRGFTLALRSRAGHLIKDLEVESNLDIHPPATDSQAIYDGEYYGGALQYYSQLTREKQDDPLTLAAYSFMLDCHSLNVEALEEAQAAIELTPEDLFLAYYLSTRYEDAPHYPHALARNKAKELWDRIIKEKPAFVLAHEKISSYLQQDDKHEEALKQLKKIQEAGLTNFYTHQLLLEIYKAMGWEREKMAQLKKIEKLRPGSNWIYNWWADYYEDLNNPEKAWEFAQKSNEADKSSEWWFLHRKASRLTEAGKLDEALRLYEELARRRPENYRILYYIARIYRMQGKFADAIAQHKKLLEIKPEDSSRYETIGDIYREWGGLHPPARQGGQQDSTGGQQDKLMQALDYYGKSLSINPGNWSLRRYVQYLKGEDENFWKPYCLSGEEVMNLIKTAPGKEAYPKASNLTVLDETITRILPDGSSSTYAHSIYKILDISGKDRHARPYASGEMLEIRIILPDGTILEPTSVYGSYTMPSLLEGACIEHKCRRDSGGAYADRPTYETDRIYFQDEGYDEPLMRSRRVLIVSKTPTRETVDFLALLGRAPFSILDFSELKQNKVGGLHPPARQSGGKNRTGEQENSRAESLPSGSVIFNVEETENEKVFSWTANDMPRIEREPFMPERSEVLPNAYFVSRRTWSDFIESFKEETRPSSSTIPTRLIREKALEIVGGLHPPARLKNQASSVKSQASQVEALYNWCMTEIKGGWGTGGAHAILLEKSGRRETLFLAFLNSLGIPYDTVLVGPGPFEGSQIDWETPRKRYFNNPLLRVLPEGGEPIFVAMHTRYLPLGKIPEYCQGAPVYIPEKGAGSTRQLGNLSLMPREELDDIADKQKFRVDLDSLTCTASLQYPDAASYGRKEYYKDLPTQERKKAVERMANSYFPGAHVKSYDLPHLQEVGRMFEISFECEVPNFLTAKEDGTIVSKTGVEPLELQQRYADKATREFPMLLRYKYLARTRVVIDLGKGYAVSELPKDLYIRNDFGSYILTFREEGDSIRVGRNLTLVPQRVKTDRYQDFLDFCRKVDEAEMGRIILRRTQAEPLGQGEKPAVTSPEKEPAEKK